MSDFLIIENVDTEVLDKQRLQLAAALLDPEVCAALGGKRLGALTGLLNMLDSWSDKRAEFFEPPVDWRSIDDVLKLLVDENWNWHRNQRCKYLALFLDTRDMRCLIRDRNQIRITLEEVAKQYTGKEDEAEETNHTG
jgi:hypothetical protein